MKKISLIAAAMFAAVTSMPAAYADYTPNIYFNGYLRSGVFHGKGGQMTKFNVNKVGRLGNENDTYGEIALGSDIIKVDDTVWTVNSRFTVADNKHNQDWQSTDGDDSSANHNHLALRELFVNAKGVLDWDKDASVWVGKRFYKREDIHITDMYYYDISGYGAGLDGLSVGSGKLDLAWIRQDDAATSYSDNKNTEYDTFVSVNKLDARYNFPVWDNANLQIADTYYIAERDNKYAHLRNEVKNANTFDIELNIGFNGGWNKTIYQWMHGSNADGVHYGTGNWLDYTGNHNSANGHRLINTGDITITDNFKLQHVENVAWSSGLDHNDVKKDNKYVRSTADKKSTYSFVIRPYYQLTKMTRLIWEAGAYYDVTKNEDGTKNKEKGQKLTMAYGITPDASNMWSRPEIRLFASYIHGTVTENDVRKDVNLTNYTNKDGSVDYNHNFMFGVQVEAWW
ncbi:carbohydrate porin [Succinivibrio dextrinosolvens]|uniref:carbohydrate porin n=1 Tax=Succinivibrio dextrinosolvens TaxID=83771 RepID=UPI0004E1A046|nr:carbohydrate porin [Succinivibrio dextrinosolvens]